MKEKYEKPVVEVVQVEFNECIAGSSTPGPNVKQGTSVHETLNGNQGTRTWGKIFPVD